MREHGGWGAGVAIFLANEIPRYLRRTMTQWFWSGEVDANLDGITETILAALEARSAAPPTGLRPVPPPRSGEG